MKIINIFLLLLCFVFCSTSGFTKDGQIDIEELIRRKEAEQQSIENISATLHQVTGNVKNDVKNKLNGIFRNEDDEIVKFDDTSDEINLEYFINLFTDNSIRRAVTDYINKIAAYIKNNADANNSEIIDFPFSVIPFVICIIMSLILCSISTVSGKEATAFPMVIKDALPNLKSYDKKADELKNNVILPIQVKKYKTKELRKTSLTVENTLEDFYGYEFESWLQIGEQAVNNLESFSNDYEFKNVYNYYQKKIIPSGRSLEDSIAETDAAEISLEGIEDKDNSLLTLLMKSRFSNRFAGSEINGVNSMLNQTDLAYISVLSENTNHDTDNSNDFWSVNAWV